MRVLVRAVVVISLAAVAGNLPAEIREHPGGKELSAAGYVRVVSEAQSPVQTLHVKTKDGLDAVAALRKPKGDGPFPLLFFVHGWPGGRGTEAIKRWTLGEDGSPVLERFLQEGFVIVAADYRKDATVAQALLPMPEDRVGALDDCLALLDYVRVLPYVDGSQINLYGSSFGGCLVARMTGLRKTHAAIIGGAVLSGFLGSQVPPEALSHPQGALHDLPFDKTLARRNVEAIQCPVLMLVGQDDFMADINRQFYDLMTQAGKPVRMEFYLHAYHGFETGPGAMAGPGKGKLPVLEGTLDALQRSVDFAKNPALPK
jgi:dipeptidyl aminopeptidase/acylaminoacyl peptidase